MTMTFVLFATSLVIILVACELFSNGVEWFGHRLNLGEGAVGSILAAIGTALPETIIPILAILLGNTASSESIGIGAIVGSSFMLATLAMFVVGMGITVFSFTRGRSRNVDARITTLSRDLRFFLFSYGLALIAALTDIRAIKLSIAVILLGAYVQYVRITLADSGEAGSDLKPLHFHRKGLPPHWKFITIQLIIALGVIVYGANLFIDQVVSLSEHFAFPALILSLLVTPIATELPEKFNSLLWVRNNKDTLAIGNISGAMVFQSCILTSFGIFATPWRLTEPAVVAACLGIASSIFLYIVLRTKKKLTSFYLLAGGVFYLGFIAYVLAVNVFGANFFTGFITRLL